MIEPGVQPQTGIPCDNDGNYTAVATSYGFYLAACACIASSYRFSGVYETFVYC